jgi:hypothetical protein
MTSGYEEWVRGLAGERNYLRARVAQLEQALKEIEALDYATADNAPSIAKQALESSPRPDWDEEQEPAR